ncbi:hypothetical protein KIPB_012015, partial [Kipferlia bialata]|eukprot:g12015.t1
MIKDRLRESQIDKERERDREQRKAREAEQKRQAERGDAESLMDNTALHMASMRRERDKKVLDRIGLLCNMSNPFTGLPSEEGERERETGGEGVLGGDVVQQVTGSYSAVVAVSSASIRVNPKDAYSTRIGTEEFQRRAKWLENNLM